MNLLDRTIEFFAPRWALRREADRSALGVFREYEAGGFGKRQSRIDRTNKSAPAETIDSLGKLRGFSRNLERNNDLIKKAIRIVGNSVVGEGIRPAIVHATKTVQAKTRELWHEWAASIDCDFLGLLTFYGIQKQVCNTIQRDGECLVVRRRFLDNEVPIRIQVVEADLLDEHKNLELENGNFVIQGVEFPKRGGKPVAYWLYNQHPGDNILYSFGTSERYDAKDVLHIYNPERPGQVRGIPTGVQAFMLTEDYKEYLDAEVVGKKIAACYTAFVTTSEGAPKNAKQLRDATRMQPGTVSYLSPGDEITFGSPPQSTGLEAFDRIMTRHIANAYEITYESLANDLSNVNFSSGRMGWVEAGRNFKHWQVHVMIPMLCDKVFEWFSEAILMKGLVKSKSSVTWTPPRREFIDPAKEIAALVEAVRAGFMSWQEVIRETGWTKEELLAELIEDRDMWDAAGLKPECDPRFDKEPKSSSEKSSNTKK